MQAQDCNDEREQSECERLRCLVSRPHANEEKSGEAGKNDGDFHYRPFMSESEITASRIASCSAAALDGSRSITGFLRCRYAQSISATTPTMTTAATTIRRAAREAVMAAPLKTPLALSPCSCQSRESRRLGRFSRNQARQSCLKTGRPAP